MRINQNTLATNAYRNLSTNNMSLGKSLEKLSSGFRINRAADDASGLVVSQGLRAQIGGMRQATRNAQDGISVVQTAEGALGEVHNILGRMRDLSVQAANTGSNDIASREAAQAEITQLSSEVQRISDQTAFGGQKLLNGDYTATARAAAAGVPEVVAVAGSPEVAQVVTPTDTVVTAVDLTGVGAAGSLDLGGTAVVLDFSGAASAGNPTGAEVASAVDAAFTAAGGTIDGVSVSISGADITFTNTTDAAIALTGSAGIDTIDAGVETVAYQAEVVAVTGVPAQAAVTATTAKVFQIGANAGESVALGIDAVSLTGLGIDGLDVSTDASSAITAIDAAIAQVSAQRGELGAVQNRFESMINNLQVTTENLVASESRIRDTDMATEMTNFTKSQILSQASTAMLAQANQVPQSVLSLLR